MSEQEAPKKGLFYWIDEKYRLVLMNDETFQEERSIRMSLTIILLGLGALTAVYIALFWLISLLVPASLSGSDQVSKSDLIGLNKEISNLEIEVESKEHQLEMLRRVVYGEHETTEDIEKEAEEEASKKPDKTDDEPIPEKSESTQELMESVEQELELGSLVEDVFMEDANVDQQVFFAPVKGIVSDTFAPSRSHFGTDIVAPKGSVIKSTQKGTVIVATWSADTGHMIGVQHADNVISFYKHNSSLLKKMGDLVEAGEAIAIIGNTGEMTDGPHLHFELWYKGQPVNPQRYVEF